MAKMKFRGSTCTVDCGGHRAGFKYGRSGKRKPSPHSKSFNKGMKMGQTQKKKDTKRKKKK